MRLFRTISTLACIIVVAALSVSVASAAPVNAPNATTFDLTCDNGATYTIVLNGNGAFTPGHVIDGDGGILIPVSFTVEATDAEGNVIFSDSATKPGRMSGVTGDLIDCTFGATLEENGETITISGEVTLFVTPRS